MEGQKSEPNRTKPNQTDIQTASNRQVGCIFPFLLLLLHSVPASLCLSPFLYKRNDHYAPIQAPTYPPYLGA